MTDAGAALMGIGMGSGDHRAMEAAQNAVSSQLLETSINGATRVLVNVTSGNDLTLAEFTEAADQISALCDQTDANIIFGWVPDAGLEGEVRITVLATGFTPGSSSEDYYSALSEQNRPLPSNYNPNLPARQPPDPNARYGNQGGGNGPVNRAPDAPQPAAEPQRKQSDDIDIPAFLRRK
jgi:cell division protein FtsZ